MTIDRNGLLFEVIQSSPVLTATFVGISNNLTELTIPQSFAHDDGYSYKVIEVKAYTCENNNILEKLTIAQTIQIIRTYAFRNCINIKIIIFEDNSNLEIVESLALDLLVKLKSCSLPSKLKNIGNWCFASSYEIQEWRIPASLEHIGTGCFSFTSSLQRFVVESGNKFFSTFNNCLYSKDFKRLLVVPGQQENVEICDITEIIGSRAITGYYIKTVKFPYMLRLIEIDAVYEWYNPINLTYCGPKIFNQVQFNQNKYPQVISTTFSPYSTNFGLSVQKVLEHCELNSIVPLPVSQSKRVCNKIMSIAYILLS